MAQHSYSAMPGVGFSTSGIRWLQGALMQIKTEIKDICLNGGDIERMVAAMAQQIVQGEGAAASPVLVGLNTKGLAIAKRLTRHMALLCGVQPPIGVAERFGY